MLVQVDPTGKGEVPGRKRAWGAAFLHSAVVVRHYIADLAPDEDVTDYPETHELSREEWVERCGDYGLTVDGKPA